jgi:hypothetical protein
MTNDLLSDPDMLARFEAQPQVLKNPVNGLYSYQVRVHKCNHTGTRCRIKPLTSLSMKLLLREKTYSKRSKHIPDAAADFP